MFNRENTYTEPIVIGTRVHCILYGGKDGIVYAIRGTQQPGSCHSMSGIVVTGGNAYFDIVWENGTESKATPECLIRSSVQWSILDGVASTEEIQALRGAAILEANRKADEAKAKAEKRASDVAALRANPKYSHLAQIEAGKYAGAAFAAANLRKELKAAFPGVKFSVQSDSFSGGDSINVSWTAGPARTEVERVANKYEAGSFDGMDDLYSYESSAWTTVFGDAKYVSCQRSVPQPGDAEYEALKAKVAALESRVA